MCEPVLTCFTCNDDGACVELKFEDLEMSTQVADIVGRWNECKSKMGPEIWGEGISLTRNPNPSMAM